MLSLGGLKFGIVNAVGNFGTVFVDQSYWQPPIAAKPARAHKCWLLGGLVRFTVHFELAAFSSLAGVAPGLPTTKSEAGSGFASRAVAVHLFGDFGSIIMATLLFMAIVHRIRGTHRRAVFDFQ